MSLHRIL